VMLSAARPLLVSSPVVARLAAPAASLQGLTFVAAQAAALQRAPVRFSLLYFLCELLVPFNVGLAPVAGALYPFPLAVMLVALAATAAAAMAFAIGRIGRQRMLSWLASSPALERQFSFIDRAITRGGFRAVFLLRLIPTPIPAVNFLYGLTGVPAAPYIAAAAAANLPVSAAVVSSGAFGKHVLLAREGLLALQPRVLVVLALLGLVAARFVAMVVGSAKSVLEGLAAECEADAAQDSPNSIEECVVDGCNPWLSPDELVSECGPALVQPALTVDDATVARAVAR